MSSRKHSAQRKAPKQAAPAVPAQKEPTPAELADALIVGQVIDRVLKAGHLKRVVDTIDDVNVLTRVIQIFQSRLNALTVPTGGALITSFAAIVSQSQKPTENPSKDSTPAPEKEKYHFSDEQKEAIRMALNSLNVHDGRVGSFMGILSDNLMKSQGLISMKIVESVAKKSRVRINTEIQKNLFYGALTSVFEESHDENPQEATDESKPAENVESHDEGNGSEEVKA